MLFRKVIKGYKFQLTKFFFLKKKSKNEKITKTVFSKKNLKKCGDFLSDTLSSFYLFMFALFCVFLRLFIFVPIVCLLKNSCSICFHVGV